MGRMLAARRATFLGCGFVAETIKVSIVACF